MPTATPLFPDAHITENTLPQLRLLRTVGFGEARSAAVAPGNLLLAVATSAGVALFELPSLRHLRFDPIEGGAQAVAFSDDGQTLLVTTQAGPDHWQLERRRVADGSRLETTPASDPSASQFIRSFLSPSGQVQATLNPLDSVPNPGVALSRVAGTATFYTDTTTLAAAFSPDSSLAALVSYAGTVRLLDLQSGAASDLPLPAIWSIAFSPDAQTLVTAGRALALWNVVDSTLQQAPDGLAFAGEPFAGAEQWASYSADGRVLTIAGEYYAFEAGLMRASAWTVGASGLAHAWDSDAAGPYLDHTDTYVGALSPATDASAWTDEGKLLEVYRNHTHQYTLTVEAGVRALAFSPDGALLAIGDAQGQIQLVRVDDGTPMHTLEAKAPAIWLAFSPDGALLGAKSHDGQIQLWHIGEQRLRAQIDDTPVPEMPWQEPRVHAPFLVTADQEWLIAWDQESVRIYRLSDGGLVKRIAVGAEAVAIGPRRRLLAILHNQQVQLWGVS
jgi:WD40 repeat protein